MKRISRVALATAALAAPLVSVQAASAAPTYGPLPSTNTVLHICVTEGAGVIRWDHQEESGTTPRLVSPADGSAACSDVINDAGTFTLTAEKYLDAPCYATADGILVNPPQLANPAQRCEGRVHDVSVQYGNGPTNVINGTEPSVTMHLGEEITVTFHITDVRLFDCTSGTGSPTTHFCEPTGPTGPTP